MAAGIAVVVGGATDAELTGANQIEVHERMGATTTYHLHYGLGIREGDIPRLVDGRLDPGAELSIVASVDGTDHCLVKGPVYGQEIVLEHGGAGSTLVVHGGDRTLEMDQEVQIAQWVDVTDADAAGSILANYFGAQDVAATDAGHYENKHTLFQRSSDLQFVRRLARRNGYLLWVTCSADGAETAHFKAPPLEGSAANELIINLDAPTVERLALSWDVGRPTSVVGAQLDLNNKETLDGSVAAPGLAVLGDRGLQAIAGTRSAAVEAAVDDAGDLQARGQGVLAEAGWFIRATCETTAHALRGIVRAHTLVNVRGAGSRYSGLYFVADVRHTIDATAHRMEIALVRNGWLA